MWGMFGKAPVAATADFLKRYKKVVKGPRLAFPSVMTRIGSSPIPDPMAGNHVVTARATIHI